MWLQIGLSFPGSFTKLSNFFKSWERKWAVANPQRIWRFSLQNSYGWGCKDYISQRVLKKRKWGKSVINMAHKVMDGMLKLVLWITKQSVKNVNSLSRQTKKYPMTSNFCEAHQQVFYYHSNTLKLFQRVSWNFIISTSLPLRGFQNIYLNCHGFT